MGEGSAKENAAAKAKEPEELEVESLDLRKGGGVTSLVSKGPVAVAAVGLAGVFALVTVAPGLALPVAIAVGLALAGGLAWVAWGLVTKRLRWKGMWAGSEFRATRRKNGKLSMKGVGPVVWPLAGVLAILEIYILAPDQAWGLWVGLFGGIALAVAAGVVARRKGRLQPVAAAEPGAAET